MIDGLKNEFFLSYKLECISGFSAPLNIYKIDFLLYNVM